MKLLVLYCIVANTVIKGLPGAKGMRGLPGPMGHDGVFGTKGEKLNVLIGFTSPH